MIPIHLEDLLALDREARGIKNLRDSGQISGGECYEKIMFFTERFAKRHGIPFGRAERLHVRAMGMNKVWIK